MLQKTEVDGGRGCIRPFYLHAQTKTYLSGVTINLELILDGLSSFNTETRR